jgi:CBS domain-containing protein
MKAGEIMTSDVVSIGPDASTRTVAEILAARGISAVPVVDTSGAPIGMISEGDLIGRNDDDRLARRDWWLTLLAEGEELHPDFLASLREPEQAARHVMSSPVVIVGEDTELSAIAQLLVSHRIKRVPVVRDNRIVGIVSRADLVRAMAVEEGSKSTLANRGGLFADTLASVDNQFSRLLHHHTAAQAATARLAKQPDDTQLTVADFRSLVADHEEQKVESRRQYQEELVERRRQRIAELIDRHISEASWRALVHKARQAAEHGEKEFLLLRFPSGLCSDGGRAINSARPEWPETLHGEAAELYLRWERDLKPQGFPVAARVLDFPGGMPGDVGLFLEWGE